MWAQFPMTMSAIGGAGEAFRTGTVARPVRRQSSRMAAKSLQGRRILVAYTRGAKLG